MQKPEIAREILAYLADHPDAHDTLDGIVQWWLLEREILYQRRMVKEVLAGLVEKGLVLEVKSSDSNIYYRMNQSKYGEILLLIKNDGTE